jgi:rhamnosyltransferase
VSGLKSANGGVPRVQVLLATYNGVRFLDQQINSILSQRGVIVSLLCRDDQSSDETRPRTLAIKERYHEAIDCISDDFRMGAAAPSFLTLLQQSELEKYDYVAFADQDDIWLPDKLAAAVHALGEQGADGYASDLIAFDDTTGREWLLKKSYAQVSLDYVFQSASAGCTYVLSQRAAKLVVEHVSGTDITSFKQKSHDCLIYAICRSHGLRWFIDKSAHIRYRQHDQNQYGAQHGLAGLSAKMKLMRTGWYRNEVIENSAYLSKADTEAQKVIAHLQRYTFADRLWLAANCFKFRRKRTEAVLLGMVFILGLA